MSAKVFFYVLLQRHELICAECAGLTDLWCDMCGQSHQNGDGGAPVYISLIFEKSSSSNQGDQFVAVLCKTCGELVPDGTRGTFIEQVQHGDGRTIFLVFKQTASRVAPWWWGCAVQADAESV